uniref:C2H2-type domain-containing protein n=1 Tax=Strongyloides papillosus TaxID=174720 RepID=A0A0N5C9J4_STREA
MSIIKECPHCLKQLRACEVEDHIKEIFDFKRYSCTTCSFTSNLKDHADSHIKLSNHTIVEKYYDKEFFNDIIKYNTTLFMNYLSTNRVNTSKVYSTTEKSPVEGSDVKQVNDTIKNDCKFINFGNEQVFSPSNSPVSNNEVLQKVDENDETKITSNDKRYPQSVKKFQYLLSICSEIGNPNTKEIVTILCKINI